MTVVEDWTNVAFVKSFVLSADFGRASGFSNKRLKTIATMAAPTT